jgi:hypothetical protein
MSTNSPQHQPQDSGEPTRTDTKPESPYPRDNYFAETDSEESNEDAGHLEFAGIAKAEWAAKSLLMDGVGRLDPIVLEEDPTQCPKDCPEFEADGECRHQSWILHDEDTTNELSEPKHYVRELESQLLTSDGLYRRRENEECGHLVSGGAIPDRPTEEFLGIVDDWLQFLQQPNSNLMITTAERERLLHRARELKRSGEKHDVTILRQLIQEVTSC